MIASAWSLIAAPRADAPRGLLPLRHPPVAALIEPPGVRDRWLAGKFDADARARDDRGVSHRPSPVFQPEFVASQVGAVETAVNGERAADQAGAVGALGDTRQRLQAANQNCRRIAHWPGDEVEAVMHPVDEVNIGIAGRAEHD